MQLSGPDQAGIALEATKLYFKSRMAYAITGLIMGGIIMCVGSVLFILGVLGGTTMTISAFGMKSNVTDAPPGAVMAIVGLFIILITRHRIDYKLDGGKAGLRFSARNSVNLNAMNSVE